MGAGSSLSSRPGAPTTRGSPAIVMLRESRRPGIPWDVVARSPEAPSSGAVRREYCHRGPIQPHPPGSVTVCLQGSGYGRRVGQYCRGVATKLETYYRAIEKAWDRSWGKITGRTAAPG